MRLMNLVESRRRLARPESSIEAQRWRPLVLPAKRKTHLSTAGTAALRNFNSAYVSLGSDSVIRRCLLNVRFAPQSGPPI